MNTRDIPYCTDNVYNPRKNKSKCNSELNTSEITKYLSLCLKDNLKTNETIYVTQDGSVYISKEFGASIKKVGMVIHGFTDLVDLKNKIPVGKRDTYYWTEDCNLYIYKNNEYINLLDCNKYVLKASEVSFDNTESTLLSVDVQNALIELYNELLKKANENHTHEISDVNNLHEILDTFAKKEDLENAFSWSDF